MGYFSGGYALSETGPQADALLDEINKVFFCQYGVTTYSDALTAYNAGKGLYAIYNKKTYLLTDYINSTFYFGQDTKALAHAGVSLSASGWTIESNVGIAPLDSPALTGTPTAPTAEANSNNEQIATTAYADRAAYSSLMEDTASGSIASFPDGAENVPVKELTADIDPIQDLHGQASPYPPNGGKNKLGALLADVKSANPSGTWTDKKYVFNGITYECATTSDGYITSVKVSGTASANSALVLWNRNSSNVSLPSGSYTLNGCPSGGSIATYKEQLQATREGSFYDFGNDIGSGVTGEILNTDLLQVTVAIVSGYAITGTLTFYPMLRLSTEADATFAPYSNICPISGYTGAEIPVTGINVWDEEWELGGISIVSGNPFSSNSRIRSKNFCPIKGGQNYYYKGTTYTTYLLFYRADESFISALTVNTSNVIAVPEDAHYFKLSPEASYGTTYNHDISINYPSTDTAYHSGTDNTTYSVSWTDHGTVYKGNLNATTGVLTVDMAMETYSSNSGFIVHSSGAFYHAGLPAGCTTVEAQRSLAKSNWAVFTTNINQYGGYFNIGGGGVYITALNAAETLADLNTRLQANPMTMLYPLATPVTYQLTPTEVQTLLGDNNIWSNTGDISVKYRCNTALYIEKKLV